ncbi:putative ubiquitin-like protein smt3 [Golovinomyces cichoracearum]|uniref:Putative ubiquitin-like protein smt3 n=1 Tax=Golovinomyces cichoracearum TaxID=62708 RepID=A0A420IMI1_9PEZI|nr:putative ubiquitin-like protein smt3 [Golovinomyces cichoracearum]
MSEENRENQCAVESLSEKMLNASIQKVTKDDFTTARNETHTGTTTGTRACSSKNALGTTTLNTKLSAISQIPSRVVDDLGSEAPTERSRKSKNKVLADSWEDDMASSQDDPDEIQSPISSQQQPTILLAPPPTPITPLASSDYYEVNDHYNYNNTYRQAKSQVDQHITTRPDKTDVIARRLISGALGIKTAPKTDHQREYEAAMVEKELNRRKKDKQDLLKAQEDIKRSEHAIWTD